MQVQPESSIINVFKLNVNNITCHGYSLTSVWIPPTIFLILLGSPHSQSSNRTVVAGTFVVVDCSSAHDTKHLKPFPCFFLFVLNDTSNLDTAEKNIFKWEDFFVNKYLLLVKILHYFSSHKTQHLHHPKPATYLLYILKQERFNNVTKNPKTHFFPLPLMSIFLQYKVGEQSSTLKYQLQFSFLG